MNSRMKSVPVFAPALLYSSSWLVSSCTSRVGNHQFLGRKGTMPRGFLHRLFIFSDPVASWVGGKSIYPVGFIRGYFPVNQGIDLAELGGW